MKKINLLFLSIAFATCISYSQNMLHLGGLNASENSILVARLATYGGNRHNIIKTTVSRDIQDVGIVVTNPLSAMARNSQPNQNNFSGPLTTWATTSYGDAAGTEGEFNSYFGYSAGYNSNEDNYQNTAIGSHAMQFCAGSLWNVAVGSWSLSSGGKGCTAIGARALGQNYGPFDHNGQAQSAGEYNTAVGYYALSANHDQDYNTAIGYSALSQNSGSYNTASGYRALHNNAGGYNTASGVFALFSNGTGQVSTASGYYSLYSNTTGHLNTAMGGYSLSDNISGSFNTATGYSALKKNNFGTYNTADGYLALTNNTTGSYNTASGTMALHKVASGNYNSGLGYRAGPATDAHLENTTAIGYLAVPTASNQVRIGNTSVTSIGGEVEWTAFSDGRFKKDIKEDVSGLEFIRELRPVSYTVDNAALNKFLHVSDSSSNQAEAKSIPLRQTGFVAQEVEAIVKKTGYVFSGVDAPENENDPYGIRYAAFVVPLVKAVQELSAEVQEQREQIQLLLAQLDSKNEKVADVNSQATLFQNTPNPFDAESEIKMVLPDNVVTATVMIYNLEGKQMKNIHVANRGDVTVKISGRELSAGMYLYSLIVDGKVMDTKRMVLTK